MGRIWEVALDPCCQATITTPFNYKFNYKKKPRTPRRLVTGRRGTTGPGDGTPDNGASLQLVLMVVG